MGHEHISDEDLKAIAARIATSARIAARTDGGAHRSLAHRQAAADRERLFRELAHHREHVTQLQTRGTELLEENRKLRAGGPAILQGMARADAWKGKSTSEISASLTKRWEALVAHGGAPEPGPSNRVDAEAIAHEFRPDGPPLFVEEQRRDLGARLSLARRQEAAAGDRRDWDGCEKAQAQVEGLLAELDALPTQEQVSDMAAQVAPRTLLDAEVQRRVDDLLLGPRPAVFDCDGRRLREVLRSWFQAPATGQPSESVDRAVAAMRELAAAIDREPGLSRGLFNAFVAASEAVHAALSCALVVSDENQAHMTRLAEMARKP